MMDNGAKIYNFGFTSFAVMDFYDNYAHDVDD